MKSKQPRPFDFGSYPKVKLAFKLAYFGWDYGGVALQPGNENTIEHEFFRALMRAKLIASPDSCGFARCGRTDAGVSALANVVSLSVRLTKDGRFLPYMTIINRGLPPAVRVTAWAVVQDQFSPRYDCSKRVYKYFFPTARMDLERMREAARKFEGTHDLRNLSKMDPSAHVKTVTGDVKSRAAESAAGADVGSQSDAVAVGSGDAELVPGETIGARVNSLGGGSPKESDGHSQVVIRPAFVRQIFRCSIEHLPTDASMGVFTVEGSAFLYHQVRCMISMLLHVGSGQENPSLIDDLLDISTCPDKPQYDMAEGYPLVLADVDFQDQLNWQSDDDQQAKARLVQHALQQLHEFKSRARIAEELLRAVDPGGEYVKDLKPLSTIPLMGYRRFADVDRYVPIMERKRAPPIDERLQGYAQKLKRRKRNESDVDSVSGE